MFTIEWHRPDLLAIQLSGFWDDDEMNAFRHEMRANLRRLQAGTRFDMLADLTDYPVQSAAIVAAQAQVIEEIQASGLRRGATVLASMLMRLQVERVNTGKHRRYFSSVADARRWLAEPFDD